MTSVLLLLAALQSSQVQGDSTWRDHDRAARAARERGDWAAARVHIRAVDSLLHGHPRVVLALARASAHLGDTAAALEAVARIARMGLFHALSRDTELALVRANPQGSALDRRLRANTAPVGRFAIAATLPAADFVAEGIGYDARRKRLLLSSIRYGKLVAALGGTVRDFIDLRQAGAWSGLGLAVDSARDRVWVASSWQPVLVGGMASDSGRAGVASYDLASRRLLRRLELPRGDHEPGDLCLAPNGELFLSDGRAGIIYRVAADGDSLAPFIPKGILVSPQGCAVDPAGERMFVADYALGIAVIRLGDGALSWLPHPPDVALNGIDGMILAGDRLIGVQNGVEPNRLIALDLDRAHGSIIAARVLAQDTSRIREPTHLVLVGDTVFFVANGGFGRYDASGRLRAGAKQEAPRIGKLALRGERISRRVDTARAKTALLAADAELARAVAATGSLAVLAAATPDAAILFPGQPILRADSARQRFLDRYPTAASYTWRASHAVASSDGSFGCTLGFSRYLSRNDTLRSGRPGSYLTCWQRRGTAGSWRIVALQRNDSANFGARYEALSLPGAPHSARVGFRGDAATEARAADAAFALLASGPGGPGPAFAGFIADDGLLPGGSRFPRGPSGAEGAFAGFPPARVLDWEPRPDFGAGSGGLAFTVGHSTTRARADSTAVFSRGKYLTVWRQRDDGRWEFILDLGSPRP